MSAGALLLHGLVEDLVVPYAPKDSPLFWALSQFAVCFAIQREFVRGLVKSGNCVRL